MVRDEPTGFPFNPVDAMSRGTCSNELRTLAAELMQCQRLKRGGRQLVDKLAVKLLRLVRLGFGPRLPQQNHNQRKQAKTSTGRKRKRSAKLVP